MRQLDDIRRDITGAMDAYERNIEYHKKQSDFWNTIAVTMYVNLKRGGATAEDVIAYYEERLNIQKPEDGPPRPSSPPDHKPIA